LVIPETVTYIGEEILFYDTDDAPYLALEELTVPFLGRTAAAADAADIYYLAGIPLPESAVWGVFYQLRSVTVLGGELIVEDAFVGCPQLEEINLPQ
jgi:hypothetical protein